MKLFDKFIEKEIKKRHPEFFLPLKEENIIKITRVSPQMITAEWRCNRELDLVIPEEKKLRMIAEQFIPIIAQNMELIRRDEFATCETVYNARIQIIPIQRGGNQNAENL